MGSKGFRVGEPFGLNARAGSAGSDSLSSAHPEQYCWICLDEAEGDDRGPMIAPCDCAKVAGRLCHQRCLARWQLQSAGTRRERVCDFCNCELPDWKAALTPPDTGAGAPAIMNVNFGGTTYSFEVKPGPEGYQEFTESIRRAFSLPTDSELNITFTCDEPSSGSLLTLQGSGAYDAAVHCASVSAARRGGTSSTRTSNSGDPGRCVSPASGQRRTSSSGQAGSRVAGRCPRAFSAIGRRLRNAFQELFV